MILSVNIDHIATIRNARGSNYPDLLRAVQISKEAGAEVVTIHLREDRRHIKDEDVFNICSANILPVNLEIAPTEEMVEIATRAKPKYVCFVPEKRQELTTEGGLNIFEIKEKLKKFTKSLQKNGIEVSLFIENSIEIIKDALSIEANTVEIHTGKFAETLDPTEFKKIETAVKFAFQNSLNVHAGHGLTFESAKLISQIKEISILHIGHFLITESIFIGLNEAVKKMKSCMI